MKKIFLGLGFTIYSVIALSQSITQKLQKAFQQFENDPQLQAAISSLYVIDAKTGKPVFEKNARIGLAPASTQKIITSVTAFELLGKDYRYKTEFAFEGDKLVIIPGGDPTFGSWRWNKEEAKVLLNRVVQSATKTNPSISGIVIDDRNWENGDIPDGWIWQDIGNYYGAGAGILNWRENQFDLVLSSGSKIGDPVQIVKTEPSLFDYELNSVAVAARKGSGDNAYIYFPVSSDKGLVKGTIPVDEKSFTISGSLPSGSGQFIGELSEAISRSNFDPPGAATSARYLNKNIDRKNLKVLHTETSPALDSIIYWFNKKSINLYGEALIKTIALEKRGFGASDTGLAILTDFWKQQGLDERELNMYDGSGLSPLNRVTTHAQVEILKYAKAKSWYPAFFDALPEYNNMKMKSGTINGVKGFCGYHKSKDGQEYIFSFLVNNYNGRASTLVSKMYKVLDVLK